MILATRNLDCPPSARTSPPRGTPACLLMPSLSRGELLSLWWDVTYISISAGYADVTQEVAQKASCLAPKTFVTTFRTVKTALLASASSSSPSKAGGGDDIVDPTAYATLVGKYKIGQPRRVEKWMKEAEAALVALPRFRHDLAPRLAESGVEVRIAVFYWVCRAIKVRNRFETSGKIIDVFSTMGGFFFYLLALALALPRSRVCSIYSWSTSTVSHPRTSIAS